MLSYSAQTMEVPLLKLHKKWQRKHKLDEENWQKTQNDSKADLHSHFFRNEKNKNLSYVHVIQFVCSHFSNKIITNLHRSFCAEEASERNMLATHSSLETEKQNLCLNLMKMSQAHQLVEIQKMLLAALNG